MKSQISEKWAWFTEKGWLREGARTLLVAVLSNCNLKCVTMNI